MDYSSGDYPGIRQSVFLIVIMMIIHPVTKSLLSFIQSTTLITLVNGILMLCFLLCFLLYMVKNNRIDKSQLTLKKVDGVILLSAILGAFCVFSFPLPSFSFFKEDTLANIVVDYIENQTDISYFIYMCLIVPVYEELIFRGLILGGLLKRYSPIIAIGIPSILFAALHLSLTGPLLFGLFVGWVYYRTRNLLYCMVMHSFVNLIGFAMRYAFYKKVVTIEVLNNFIQMNILLISTVLVPLFAICIYVLHIRLKKNILKQVNIYV